MALFDYLKNKKSGLGEGSSATTAASCNPAAENPSPHTATPRTFQEWLVENASLWDDVDALACERSATSAEEARAILYGFLSLDDDVSIAFWHGALAVWKMKSDYQSVTLGRCTSCEHTAMLMGHAHAAKSDHKCPECHEPIDCKSIFYSRQLGTALRQQILPQHAWCIEARKVITHDFQPDGLLSNKSRTVMKAFAEFVRTVGHERGIEEADRQLKGVEIMDIVAVCRGGISKLTDQAILSSILEEGITPQQLQSALASVIQALTDKCQQCFDSGHTDLAIHSLQKAIELRTQLMAPLPRSAELQAAQARNLNTLGMMLRARRPSLRLNALGFVREASEIVAALDREDSPGRESRRQTRDDISRNLALNW